MKMSKDIMNPIGSVSATSTQTGQKEQPEAMTALKMGISTKGNSVPPASGKGKEGATGPGKKSGTI